ncbi:MULTISPECIES: DUF1178 family protein [Paracoccus]|uniref:DUF1178 family protein n=1 Tax=Paracoccus aerius TaxID=1915382 RepID=A0ABS1S788_9RHOB|nr:MULTISPECIES: DUF1178 family protein [Paracoccus]MBL3674598.1 DUF1178 family protein [Paracoccus aerius]QIR85630.1 DUF1178 family protein [Paracoccus sp. AK26]GHG26973.1 hypothetical protein GCM10017322_26770 [Paracoccus aerius]
MIRYALRCEKGHDFDGWFRSSDAFETTRAAGHVACTQCGSSQVEKSLMAPAVPAAKKAEPAMNPVEAALHALRQQVEANSDYVGLKFADEARAMHEGRVPGRAIHGEAKPEEARKLIEDGVPVAPLPFIPRQKTN